MKAGLDSSFVFLCMTEAQLMTVHKYSIYLYSDLILYIVHVSIDVQVVYLFSHDFIQW